MLCIDRTRNILYYRDGGFYEIRSIQLDKSRLLCTLTGGPSILTTAGIGHGGALGPASTMRGSFCLALAVDEGTGTLYYALATPSTSGANDYSAISLYKAKFY